MNSRAHLIFIASCLICVGTAFPQVYHLRTVYAGLPFGSWISPTLCFDSNRDGRYDMTVGAIIPGWQIWENVADSFTLQYTNPIQFAVWDIGDVDQDGLIDQVMEGMESLGAVHRVLTCESPDSFSYPTVLNWMLVTNTNDPSPWPSYYPGDLDHSGRQAIVYGAYADTVAIYILKNVGDNDNRRVWKTPWGSAGGGKIAFGDFDQDGMADFAQASGDWNDHISVFENTGINQYQRVFLDSIPYPGGHYDAFPCHNLKGDNKPGFLVDCFVPQGANVYKCYLYLWQATGVHQYQRICVDTTAVSTITFPDDLGSCCADLDGDGVEEIAQAAGPVVNIYKYSNGQFRRMAQYLFHDYSCGIRAVDINHDGYPELTLSDECPTPRTDVIEVAALALRSPNGGEVFPVGSRQAIRWFVYQPPHCDSCSVSYSTDNGRAYNPIASALPPADTVYFPWTVPDTPSDSCRVKVTAYGPGVQHVESNNCFRITSAGIEEETTGVVLKTKLIAALPNPCAGTARIWFQLKQGGDVSLVVRNATGRTMATLAKGTMKPGRYCRELRAGSVPAGVYFVILTTKDCRETHKLVVDK